jgi:hypothetical protein
MDEINYLVGELTDEFFYAQANAGDYLLEEQGFQVGSSTWLEPKSVTPKFRIDIRSARFSAELTDGQAQAMGYERLARNVFYLEA